MFIPVRTSLPLQYGLTFFDFAQILQNNFFIILFGINVAGDPQNKKIKSRK